VTDLDKAIVQLTVGKAFFACCSCRYLKVPCRDMKCMKLLCLQNIRFSKDGHFLSTRHGSARFGTRTDWNRYHHITSGVCRSPSSSHLHHAYWQMAEHRIFALHQKASGAFLVACCKTNAHVTVVSNNTRDCTTSSFVRGSLTAQPPQQCQDETKYWKRHVSMGATAGFLPFQLID
jgi:hypothetical protein